MPTRLLLATAALACSACAAPVATNGAANAATNAATHAPERAQAGFALDVDRACLSAAWQAPASAQPGEGRVSVDNRCGRPLVCRAHVALRAEAGPDLYLDCAERSLPPGRTPALCGGPVPAVAAGSGSLRCR